jgi:hypothetical protein
MRHRGRRLRSVRKARRVAEVQVAGVGNAIDERTQYGEATYAGVKDADLWTAGRFA